MAQPPTKKRCELKTVLNIFTLYVKTLIEIVTLLLIVASLMPLIPLIAVYEYNENKYSTQNGESGGTYRIKNPKHTLPHT